MKRGRVARYGMGALRRLYAGSLIPVSKVRLLRRIVVGEDPLLPSAPVTTGRDLRNPFLAAALADVELGVWRLGAGTLDFLEGQIALRKPKLIIECGSGISTVCFARYMQELHGDGEQLYVVAIDQDARFCQDTLERLEKLNLAQHARVIHAPLRRQVVEGVDLDCYDIPADLLDSVLAGRRPDFVLIDGPAADDLTRFGTLPLLRRWLSDPAHFYLDDALRDGELSVAEHWAALPYITVDGLSFDGKGLLLGRIAGRPDVPRHGSKRLS